MAHQTGSPQIDMRIRADAQDAMVGALHAGGLVANGITGVLSIGDGRGGMTTLGNTTMRMENVPITRNRTFFTNGNGGAIGPQGHQGLMGDFTINGSYGHQSIHLADGKKIELQDLAEMYLELMHKVEDLTLQVEDLLEARGD